MTVEAFLLDHDPSQMMDFYQIFVNDASIVGFDNLSMDVGVSMLLGLMLGSLLVLLLDLGNGNRSVHSLWSKCLHTLGTMSKPHASYISTFELPRRYQNIMNHDSLLILDSCASVCITPH
jgi:hypothetical protein